MSGIIDGSTIFIDVYNNDWVPRKNGYLSPIEKRNRFDGFIDKKAA